MFLHLSPKRYVLWDRRVSARCGSVYLHEEIHFQLRAFSEEGLKKAYCEMVLANERSNQPPEYCWPHFNHGNQLLNWTPFSLKLRRFNLVIRGNDHLPVPHISGLTHVPTKEGEKKLDLLVPLPPFKTLVLWHLPTANWGRVEEELQCQKRQQRESGFCLCRDVRRDPVIVYMHSKGLNVMAWETFGAPLHGREGRN